MKLPSSIICIFFILSILTGDRLFGEETKKDFTIGVLLCLTGACAESGYQSLHGIEIAIKEINARGGILGREISLKVQDSDEAVSGAKAVSGYRQIRLNPDITYFIGPTWSPGGLSLAPIISKEKIIMTSPSVGISDFHKAGKNIFNIHGTSEIPTRAAAKYIIEKGWKNCAIFSSEQPWSHQQGLVFEEEYKKLGGKITTKVTPLPTSTTLSAEALQIKLSKPDVIFFSSFVELGLATRELKKLGWQGPQLAALLDQARIDSASGALEGTMYYSYLPPSKEFADKYFALYKSRPELPASAGYDAVYAYFHAIASAQTFDVDKVQEEMTRIRFKGASDEIYFNNTGEIVKDIVLWGVSNNQLEIIKDKKFLDLQ